MDVILPEASAAGNRSSITAAVRRNARVLTPFAALVISVCMGNGQSAVRRNASVQEAQVTAALALGLDTVPFCTLYLPPLLLGNLSTRLQSFYSRSMNPRIRHSRDS
jgi:hypothetical protein